jgi:predicted acylesterase/phospholipase RssA
MPRTAKRDRCIGLLPHGGGRMMRALLLISTIAITACTTVLSRAPVPEGEIDAAAPYGIPFDTGQARAWGDTLGEGGADAILETWTARLRVIKSEEIESGVPIEEISLALSGGGAKGAFSAGLLNGWTARGDRPEFTIVTGISTGAIVALFAFLGPDYDDVLTKIYTAYSTDQLLTSTIFAGLTGGAALADTSGYRRLIETYVDEEVVSRLADEFDKGRILLVGTTNLDVSRPMIWDLSRIASSRHPQARTLIQDIIQASSAIPVAFPPVLIPVETSDGKRYDEMHVDGAATQQVMFFSPEFPMKRVDERLGASFDRTMYVIVNNKNDHPYDPVRPRVFAIAGAAIGSLLGGSGVGDLYKIYTIAQRDDIGFNVVSIPNEFTLVAEEPFDPVYMKALYDLGYEYGLAGGRWSDRPPNFVPWP